MYDKYNQHSELIRLVGAAAVSKEFRQRLLGNPEQVLERGYLGYQFDLTTEEAALVTNAAAGNIHEFSLQVWEWMGCNGNGAHPKNESYQTTLPAEDAVISSPSPKTPVSLKEENLYSACLQSSQHPWQGTGEPL